MARHSPVTGRYVTIEVDGLEYKVFYLHNGRGQPLSASTPPAATTTSGAACWKMTRSPRTTT